MLPLVFLSGALALFGPWPEEEDPALSIAGLYDGQICPVVEAGSFHWVWKDAVVSGGALDWHPAVFLATPSNGAARDVYVADFKVTSDGRLRDLRRMTNLSRSADADEEVINCSGDGRMR